MANPCVPGLGGRARPPAGDGRPRQRGERIPGRAHRAGRGDQPTGLQRHTADSRPPAGWLARPGDRAVLAPVTAAARRQAAELRGRLRMEGLRGPVRRAGQTLRPGRGRHGHAVRRAALRRRARRHGEIPEDHRDRHRGRRDRPRDLYVPRHPLVAQLHGPRHGPALPQRPTAGVRIPQRAARAPHRLQGGELPGEPAALPCGQRPGDAKLPDRSWAVARDAARQGLPGQEARPGSAQRRGAHRRPGRAHRTGVPLARGPTARPSALHGRPRRVLLVPAAPEPPRPPDALGLADRPGDPTAADGQACRGHLRHRRLPDHSGRNPAAPHDLAGQYAGSPEGRLLPGPGLGGLPPGRQPGAVRPLLPGERAREDLLRLPAGALGRLPPAQQAQADAQ